jgi:GNAT superfamily N-acetyltransferase
VGQIETVSSDERDAVLARVLVPRGGAARASQGHVRSFARYLSTCALEWTAWRYRRERRETACLFVLYLPGKTAIVLFPPPEARGIRRDDQCRLLKASMERLTSSSLYYAQALVEAEASGQRSLLEECGFEHLTQLIYTQRSTRSPWVAPPEPHEATWIRYDDAHHAAFAQILLATYEDSRDCPELTGLRGIDAVIASHKAAGEFDPALWEIARVDGADAGCILLAALTHGPLLEVVYMGVARAARGRGVGKLLLRRALAQCERVGAHELTAVVDRRNTPARQLYAQFGFKPTATREAYIHVW